MKDKKSLHQPATKQDIAELRSETKQDISALKKDVAELRSETKRSIAKSRLETKKDIAGLRNETLEHIDGLSKLIKDQTEDFQLHNMTHQREREQLDNHEERISGLEQRRI